MSTGNQQNKADDLYSGFENFGYEGDCESLLDNDFVRDAIKTSYGQRRAPLPNHSKKSPLPRLKTGNLPTGSVAPLNTSCFSVETEYSPNAKTRPLTAVRPAGFTKSAGSRRKVSPTSPSHGNNEVASRSQMVLEETPREANRKMELDIINLIEECSRDMESGDKRMALQKAKKAVHKERLLMKHRDIEGIEPGSFLDVSYSVRLNLAVLYEANDLPEEAIEAYQEIIRNKAFPNAGKLRVNLGNLYFKMGRLGEAIKEYRRALDSISEEFTHIRSKILMNIGTIFVKMEQYSEAVSSYEHIMKKCPNYHTAYHLVLCYHALADAEKTKRAFQRLLATYTIGHTSQDSYTISNENLPELHVLLDAIKTDSLCKIETRQKSEMERFILRSAQLIAPYIEETETDGFEWCVETIKASPYRDIASELEISKAMIMLRRSNFTEAANALKHFEKQNTKIASHAANNLSFLYFQKGELEAAEKYVDESVQNDLYNYRAYVNKGNVLYAKGRFQEAAGYYNGAIAIESDCVEAHYNMGLCLKSIGSYRLAEKSFSKYNTIICGCPEALYHLATISLARGDVPEAINRFTEILSLIPNDPAVCVELSNIFSDQRDESNALQYMFEAYKSNPASVHVLSWIAQFFFHHKNYERAGQFFEKAILVEPSDSKWYLAVGTCQLRSGNYHDALETYRVVHAKFPRDITCLRSLVKLTRDMNLKDAKMYEEKLATLEQQVHSEVLVTPTSPTKPPPSTTPTLSGQLSRTKSRSISKLRRTSSTSVSRPKTRRMTKRISEGGLSGGVPSSDSFGDMDLNEMLPGCSSTSSSSTVPDINLPTERT